MCGSRVCDGNCQREDQRGREKALKGLRRIDQSGNQVLFELKHDGSSDGSSAPLGSEAVGGGISGAGGKKRQDQGAVGMEWEGLSPHPRQSRLHQCQRQALRENACVCVCVNVHI